MAINWLNVSPGTQFGLTQLLGFVCAFGYGLGGGKRSYIVIPVFIGLLSDVVGGVVIYGGGPDACAGLFVLPPLCVICAYGGRGVWWLTRGRKTGPTWACAQCGRKISSSVHGRCPRCGAVMPPHCHVCGYDLTGNITGRCPECGAPARSPCRVCGCDLTDSSGAQCPDCGTAIEV